MKYLTRFCNDIKKYFGYACYAAKVELKAEVAGSILNWLWWIVEPFCLMLVYSFMFSVVFDAKKPYFSIYIFLGLTIWNFFQRNVKASVKMIKNNKQIIKKVYVPKVVLIMKRMLTFEFKMFINFGIIVAMLIVFQVPVTLNYLWILPMFVLLNLFTFGVMAIFLHIGVFVEDLGNVVNIAMKMMFYMTGIFYSVEERIQPYGQYFAKWNPIALIINTFRKAILYNEMPDIAPILVWTGISLVLAISGILLIYRNENNYVKVV